MKLQKHSFSVFNVVIMLYEKLILIVRRNTRLTWMVWANKHLASGHWSGSSYSASLTLLEPWRIQLLFAVTTSWLEVHKNSLLDIFITVVVLWSLLLMRRDWGWNAHPSVLPTIHFFYTHYSLFRVMKSGLEPIPACTGARQTCMKWTCLCKVIWEIMPVSCSLL